MKIPGVGLPTATILVSLSGKVTDFKNGREFAAYLGLVPREHSTGGKQRLLGITKRGDRYARTLLIHGARSILRCLVNGCAPFGDGGRGIWLKELLDRRGYNRASVALANKMARVAWSMLAHGTEYEALA